MTPNYSDNPVKPRVISSRVVEVVQVVFLVGTGTEDDPARHEHTYFTKKGVMIATIDTLNHDGEVPEP